MRTVFESQETSHCTFPPLVPLNGLKVPEQKALRSAENNRRDSVTDIGHSDGEEEDIYRSLTSIQSLSSGESEVEVGGEHKIRNAPLT